MRAIAGLMLALGLAGPAAAQASRLVPPGQPEPDCRAPIGYDRNQEAPGYRLPGADGAEVCVPFLASVARPPADYPGRDFYVDEFTDAKLKARWQACKDDAACAARLKPQIDRWLPPNKARSTRVTGTVDPAGRIEPDGEVDLRQIRRPAFFAKAPYGEPIAEADPRTWIVEFTAPHDPFERIKLGQTGEIKLRGWYVEGEGVEEAGRRTRALVFVSPGGGNQLTAIQNAADAAYTVDPATRRITENRFPNATTEGFGMARWRQVLYRLNLAGFDILALDRRGEGLSGGFSDTNTLEQSEDIFRVLDEMDTGAGMRLLGPAGQLLAGQEAVGKLLAGQSSRQIPILLAGYSRGSMATGWAMQKNFVESCSYDLPSVACGPAKALGNIKGAIMIASFGSGAGYLPDSPDLKDRNLFLGAMAAEHNIVFYPNSAVLAGMDRWPAAFFGKGLWDRAESLEGTVAAYDRVKGPKEIFAGRGPHGLETWAPAAVDRLTERLVAFSRAVVLGRPVDGQPRWTTMKELVATSPDAWEPSSQPVR